MKLKLSNSDSRRKTDGVNGMPPVRPIKSVTIEFEDGEIETFTLPPETGFFRQSYTYEPKEGGGSGLNKWGDQIRTNEIFWAEIVIPS